MPSENCPAGFTLIELTLAMMVLGILIAVVVTAINPAQRLAQAKDAKRIADLKQIAEVLNAHFTANSSFPLPTCTFNGWERSEKTGDEGDCSGNKSDFMEYLSAGSWLKTVPLDPQHYKNNPYWGYLYQQQNGGEAFCLLAHLEDASNQILVNDSSCDNGFSSPYGESWWFAIGSD